MNKKFIFLDIDGTLISFAGNFLPQTREALEAAHKNGHKLIISTGRQHSQIYPWLLDLGVFDAVIATAGANIRVEGKTLSTHFIQKDKLEFIHQYLEKNQTPYAVQTQTQMVVEPWCAEKIAAYNKKAGMSEEKAKSLFGGVKIVNDISKLDNAEKIAYYCAPKSAKEVAQDIGDYFNVNIFSFGNAPDTNGEISINGVNKASGMREILEYFCGRREDTFAFGDADNDIEMLEFANVGVAMGNATQTLKQSADYITDDVEAGGLYNAFKKFGLI